ncbi:transmembrane protein 192-like [Oppia nitens]|uniref:transmembrane protein 192-like n=1 Tax=Oppia nitens TaxID=1686743 RepID=UPI0023DC9ED3|nr:transmembrane protein 192-like [Oppia nitens]
MDDDLQILTLPYHNDLQSLYSQTNNNTALALIVLQFLLLLTTIVTSFVIPINDLTIETYSSVLSKSDMKINYSDNNKKIMNSYFLTIVSHLIVWLLTLSIGYYMRNVYYRRLRILGYYKHHQLVRWLSHIPAFVLHKSNVALLILTAILYNIGQKDIIKLSDKIQLKPVNFEQLIVTVSVLIVMPFLIKWFYHEIRFRTDRNPPDIFCVEDPQRLVTSAGLNEIGVRPSSYLEDLLEKQADLIYNLKLQNTHLRQMLFKVSQRSGRESLQSS